MKWRKPKQGKNTKAYIEQARIATLLQRCIIKRLTEWSLLASKFFSCSCKVLTLLVAPLSSCWIFDSLCGSIHLANSDRKASTYSCSFSSIKRKVCTLCVSNCRNLSTFKRFIVIGRNDNYNELNLNKIFK